MPGEIHLQSPPAPCLPPQYHELQSLITSAGMLLWRDECVNLAVFAVRTLHTDWATGARPNMHPLVYLQISANSDQASVV